MKKKLVIIAIFAFILCNANPVLATTQSNAEVEWQSLFGGEAGELCRSIQPTEDGGYILVGETNSSGGDVTRPRTGDRDFWVVKVDADGAMQWQKCLGGSGDDFAFSIQQTRDGGYIVGGAARSTDGDVLFGLGESADGLVHHGEIDAWVIKLDADGEIQWQKLYGGSSIDYIIDIQQTSDGGYSFTGTTSSTDYDLTGREKSSDNIWVAKLDETGAIEWQSYLGGSPGANSRRIIENNDGGYVVAGDIFFSFGDMPNHGISDFFISKIDAKGELEWQKCFGGSGRDSAYGMEVTSDGGYILVGNAKSKDGDLLFGVEEAAAALVNRGAFDAWIVKLDAGGSLLWQKSLGGSSHDAAMDVRQTIDGGYIVAGSTSSTDYDILFGVEDAEGGLVNHGASDAWLVKLDANGTMLWQKSVGGTSTDSVYGIQEKSEGEYVFAGTTTSADGEQSGTHGPPDFWLVKLVMKDSEANDSNGDASMNRPRPLIRERSFGGKTVAVFRNKGFGLMKVVDPATGDIDFRARLQSVERDVRLKIPFADIQRKVDIGAKSLIIEYRGQTILIPMPSFDCEELLFGMLFQDEAMIEIHLTENEDGSIEKVIQLLVVEQVDEKTKLVHRVNVQ